MFYIRIQAGVDRRVSDFSEDIKDSVVYIHLIHQIAPEDTGVNKLALQKIDMTERAKETLQQADKINCNEWVTAYAIVNSVHKVFIWILIQVPTSFDTYVLFINFSAKYRLCY